MNRSCQGLGSFTNAFFSNLKTVNSKTFSNYERIQLKIALTSPTALQSLKLIVIKRFQSLCHIQPNWTYCL